MYAKLIEVNVSYILENTTDNAVKIVTVIIDSKLKDVIKVRADPLIYAGTSYNFYIWAGYSFYGNNSATIALYESKTTYIMPAISKPNPPNYTDNNACRVDLDKPKCMLMIWTGLMDTYVGNKIAQGGSVGEVSCTSSTTCNIKYYLFFEFYPSPAAICESNPPYNAGDSITATVTNKAKTNGSNTKYNIVIIDNTNGSGCGIFDYDFNLPSPYYSAFINERPKYCKPSQPNCAPNQAVTSLPMFTSDTMTGWIYYSGSTRSIYTLVVGITGLP